MSGKRLGKSTNGHECGYLENNEVVDNCSAGGSGKQCIAMRTHLRESPSSALSLRRRDAMRSRGSRLYVE